MGYDRTPEHRYNPGDPGVTIILGAKGLDEFHGYTGDCGQASAEVALAAHRQRDPDPDEMNAMVRDMIAHNECGPGGDTSLQKLAIMLRRWNLSCDPSNQWKSLLSKYAGNRAMVIGMGNAGVLPGEHPGLRGHFVCCVGKGDKGYICSDPNSLAAKEGKLIYFTEDELGRAEVWGVVFPHESAPTSGGGSSGNGDGTPLADTSTNEGGFGKAHEILQELPGFYGIVSAVDKVETINDFPPPPGNILDAPKYLPQVASWSFHNIGAIFFRLAIVGFGLMLLIGLYLAIIFKSVGKTAEIAAPIAGVALAGQTGGASLALSQPRSASPPVQSGSSAPSSAGASVGNVGGQP